MIFRRDQTLREQKKAIEDDPSYWEWLDQLNEQQNEQHHEDDQEQDYAKHQ